MIAHENPGEFDHLDAYIRVANAEALAVLAARIDTEKHLRCLLQEAEHSPRYAQKPEDDGR